VEALVDGEERSLHFVVLTQALSHPFNFTKKILSFASHATLSRYCIAEQDSFLWGVIFVGLTFGGGVGLFCRVCLLGWGGEGWGRGLGAARALEHREAVLDRRGLRVEVLVRRPLLAPARLPRVEKGARVRLLEDLRLRIDVLVGPARGHDVVRHGRTELAVRVLAPQVLGRGLVAVEPLAGPLDLAGLGAALDADARLDAHDLGVRLHVVGHGREVRHGLLGGGGREALALVLSGLARKGDLLVGVGGVGPRVEGLV